MKQKKDKWLKKRNVSLYPTKNITLCKQIPPATYIDTHIYITLYGKKTDVENLKFSRNLGIKKSSGLSTFFSPVNLSLKMVWFSEVEELYRT